MRIARRLFAKRLQNIDLARRVIYMVIATNHVGDTHVRIVNHDGEIVGW